VTEWAGGNAGIGLATVRALARHGAHVIISARSEQRTEQVCKQIAADGRVKSSGGSVEGMLCDLASPDSIRAFVENFRKLNRPLHGLVNNAGIMWMPFALTKDGLEMHAAVNHCGHFLLTHLLMDLLIANSPSRIVNVSSRMYKFGNKPIDTGTFRPASEASFSRQVAYQQSKLANILFTCELNRRFGDRGVSSYAVHPGVVATDLIKDVPCGSALKCPIWLICFKTTAQGAGTTVHCLLTDALPTAQSFYFSNCKSGPVPKALVNAEDAQKLWEWSETNVSVKPEKKGDDSDRKT